MELISGTEPARLAQGFAREPFQRMGGLGFPASGPRTGPSCTPATQGTDSRLCGALPPARGGKHVHEVTLNSTDPRERLWNLNRRRRELEGSQPASPRFNCPIHPK